MSRFEKPSRRWTEAELDFVRRHVTTLSHAQIGARLNRPKGSIKALVNRSGLSDGTLRFTDQEKLLVRKMISENASDSEIATSIGKKVASVGRLRRKMGFAKKLCPLGDSFETFIFVKHAEGLSDTEIASQWTSMHPGCAAVDRHTIAERRGRHQLPDNRFSEHARKRVAAKTKEQLAAAGLENLAQLRVRAHRERAIASGWPSDLRLRQTQILSALWAHGPMTRIEIAEKIGMPWKGSRTSLTGNDREGTYLANLIARGLVVNLGRKIYNGGPSKNTCVYSIPLFLERTPPQEVCAS
jgi:hypothetical protein